MIPMTECSKNDVYFSHGQPQKLKKYLVLLQKSGKFQVIYKKDTHNFLETPAERELLTHNTHT